MNKKAKKFDYVLAVIFVFLVIITIYPFLNVLAISFNDSTDTIKNVNFIIPRKFTLSNYKYVFKDGGIAMPGCDFCNKNHHRNNRRYCMYLDGCLHIKPQRLRTPQTISASVRCYHVCRWRNDSGIPSDYPYLKAGQ